MGIINYIKNKTRAHAAKFFGFETNGRGWVTLAGERIKEQEKNGFEDAALRAIVSAACNGELQLKKLRS